MERYLLDIPQIGKKDIDLSLLPLCGECYCKNVDECINSNFYSIEIEDHTLLLCDKGNSSGLYHYLRDFTPYGSSFWNFEGLNCPGLDFFYWALDECSDDELEDVSWFQSVMKILEDSGKVQTVQAEDRTIYVLIDFDLAIEPDVFNIIENTADDLLRDSIMSIIEDIKGEPTVKSYDDYGWELDEYGMQIVKDIWYSK